MHGRRWTGFLLAARVVAATLTGATVAAFAANALASPRADAALARAVAAMQRGEFAAAAGALRPAMRGLDRNARAWRTLGLAHLRLHEPAEAEAAFARALELEPANPQPLFYRGVAAAQRGDANAAFDSLAKARASARVDMTQMEVEQDLAPLRTDPRYAALLPRPEDFASPFVEPVTVLREWDGEAAGDQFGWIARVIGDVDGDGIDDFVTSAPTKAIEGDNAGRVYVYSGRTGALVWRVDGAPGEQFGSGLEAAGDYDGDGIPDVVAGAPEADLARILSGRDGRVLATLRGEAKGDRFGEHVATAGDFDGDGFADVLVGAPGNGAGGAGAGRAYLYSGRDGHLLLTLTGERAGDGFGSTVAGFANGRDRFLVVGAPKAGPRRNGRVYVYDRLAATPRFVIGADPSGVALGAMFVAVLGDVDGDGVPDVFASDWSDATLGPGTGKVYVVSGRTGRRLHTLTGETAGEGFGTTHSVAGDVNGDGRADLIVGAWQYAGAAQSGGRASLYDGRSGRRLRTYTSRIPGDTFGFDAVGTNIPDAAGRRTLLITAGWSAVHGHHSGRIFLIAIDAPAA